METVKVLWHFKGKKEKSFHVKIKRSSERLDLATDIYYNVLEETVVGTVRRAKYSWYLVGIFLYSFFDILGFNK